MNNYLESDNRITMLYLNQWKGHFAEKYDRKQWNLSILCMHIYELFQTSPPISINEFVDVKPKNVGPQIQQYKRSKKDEMIEYFQEQLAKKDKEIILL